jgi:Killing trait
MADESQTSATPGDLAEALAAANLKAVAEQPAMLANLAFSNLVQNTNLAQQNAVAHQQAMNQITVAVVAKAVTLVANLGPMEVVSAEKVLTRNSVAEEISDLRAAGGAAPAAEPKEAKETTASSTGSPSGGSTLESLSGDALATAFAVLNAILGGKSDKGGKETS